MRIKKSWTKILAYNAREFINSTLKSWNISIAYYFYIFILRDSIKKFYNKNSSFYRDAKSVLLV